MVRIISSTKIRSCIMGSLCLQLIRSVPANSMQVFWRGPTGTDRHFMSLRFLLFNVMQNKLSLAFCLQGIYWENISYFTLIVICLLFLVPLGTLQSACLCWSSCGHGFSKYHVTNVRFAYWLKRKLRFLRICRFPCPLKLKRHLKHM